MLVLQIPCVRVRGLVGGRVGGRVGLLRMRRREEVCGGRERRRVILRDLDARDEDGWHLLEPN